MRSAGLVLVKSNAEMMAEEQDAARSQVEAEEKRQESVKASLAHHINNFWEEAKREKESIEKDLLATVRQISGVYSSDKLEKIKEQGLPAIYMRLTSVKCRAAKSWIRDILMHAGDRPWNLKPTKIPEMRHDHKQQIAMKVQQDAMKFGQMTGQQVTKEQMLSVFEKLEDQAKKMMREQAEDQCERMADTIEDQLQEGGWDKSFNDIISDVVDYKAAIMKGPVMRKRKHIKWNREAQKIEVVNDIRKEVERVDPFRFYPAPGIVDPQEGDCIEVIDYTVKTLYDCIGLPGYDESAIRRVIAKHGMQGLQSWTRESLKSNLKTARGQTSTNHNDNSTIEALQYWGCVRGELLLEWGMSAEKIPDPDDSYDIKAEYIDGEIICVRMNPDPLGRKPYSKACFEDIPGAFWGNGVPDLIRDCQDVCNAAARAMVANMGISSGPQVAVDTNALPPGESITQMYPWKIWQMDFTKGGTNGTRPPIQFFQPNANTQALMQVFQEYSSLADEYSGIPSYSYGVGDSVGGAGDTASGLSMLMNAASKAIKDVIKHIDSGIIRPVIERYYVYNMLWHEDQSLKGDAQVVARGAMALVVKEQNQMRLQEILDRTNNPTDMQIIGPTGRAELLRKAFHGVDVGADFIPSDEELRAQMDQQAAQAAAQQGMIAQ